MTVNEKFNNILGTCKLNDIVYVATEFTRIYGRVKNYSVLEGWIEIGITEDKCVKIKSTDIIDCELFNESRLENKKLQTEKFLEMFAIKYKIPFDTFKKDVEKNHLAISRLSKIWNILLDYEKERLLSIFQIDKEGMDFLMTKLNHQSLIIKGQKKQIDGLNKMIQDLTDTYNI